LPNLQLLFTILTVVAIPFSTTLPNIFLIISLVLLFFCKRKVEYKPLIPISIFVISTGIIYFINGNFITDFSSYSRYLLIIAFAFILINSNQIIVKKALLIGVNLAIFISVVKMLNLYLSHGKLDLSNGDTIFKVIFIDRPFFGFLTFIASMVTFDLAKNKEITKKIAISLIMINIAFIFFIAARLTILSYLMAGVLYFLFFFKIKNVYKIIISAGLISVFALFASVNDNIRNRFKLDKGTEIFVDNEPRFVIWPCTIKTIENSNWITGGNNAKQITNRLAECYSEVITNPSKKDWYLNIKYNPHNQFFYIMLTSGFIGICTFLYFLVSLFLKSKDYTKISIAIAFLLFITLDCVLYRQVGCYFTALVISIIYLNNEKSLLAKK